MKLFLPWPAHTPVGVDLSGRYLKAAQCLVGPSGSPRLSGCARAARPGVATRAPALTADDAGLIAGLVERGGFHGQSLVVAVPRELLMSAALELPPRSSGAPLEQIARLELARTHRVDPGSFEMAMWDLPAPARSSEGTYAMAVGLASAGIEPFLEALAGLGLEVVALDARPLALQRAALPLLATDGLSCLVDVNWHGLSVVISLGGCVVVERFVDTAAWARVCIDGSARAGISPDAVHSALCDDAAPAADGAPATLRSLATEYLEAVVPEVARSVSYAAHRYPHAPLRRVLLSGDAWSLPGLKDRLAQSQNVAVQLLDPGHLVTLPRAGIAQTPSAAAAGALGLALHSARTAARSAA